MPRAEEDSDVHDESRKVGPSDLHAEGLPDWGGDEELERGIKQQAERQQALVINLSETHTSTRPRSAFSSRSLQIHLVGGQMKLAASNKRSRTLRHHQAVAGLRRYDEEQAIAARRAGVRVNVRGGTMAVKAANSTIVILSPEGPLYGDSETDELEKAIIARPHRQHRCW